MGDLLLFCPPKKCQHFWMLSPERLLLPSFKTRSRRVQYIWFKNPIQCLFLFIKKMSFIVLRIGLGVLLLFKNLLFISVLFPWKNDRFPKNDAKSVGLGVFLHFFLSFVPFYFVPFVPLKERCPALVTRLSQMCWHSHSHYIFKICILIII